MPRIVRCAQRHLIASIDNNLLVAVNVDMNAHFKWLTTNALKADASLPSPVHSLSLSFIAIYSHFSVWSHTSHKILIYCCVGSIRSMIGFFHFWSAHIHNARSQFLLAIICACAIHSNELHRDFKNVLQLQKKGNSTIPPSLFFPVNFHSITGKTWIMAICNLC